LGHCEPLIVRLGVLHCPQAGGREGKDGRLEGGRGHQRLSEEGEANVLHPGYGLGDLDCCARPIGRRVFD